MVLMDFNLIMETPQTFIGFFQRLEFHEAGGHEDKNSKESRKSGIKKGSNKRKAGQSMSFEAGLDCILHGKNCGHSTDSCWTLKKQAEKMKKNKKPSNSDKDMNFLMKKAVIEAINVASGAKKAKKAAKKDRAEELQAFSQLTVLSNGEIAESVEDSDPDGDTDKE